MRNILKVIFFSGLIQCGFSTSRVTATLYALNCDQPPWMVGVILSLYAFFPALLSIHAGRWIDKIGVRIPIVISAVMISLSCAFPLVLPYSKAGIWPLYFTCVLAGTGFLFTLIAAQGLVGHLANNKNRATAFTYQSMAFAASGSIGPVMAGYVIQNLGYEVAFGLPLCITVAGALAFFAVAPSLPDRCNNVAKVKSNDKTGLFSLLKISVVRNVMIASAMVSMAWDLQAFMIPVYGTEIGLDAVQIGWLLSTFSAFSFGVRVVMPFISRLFREWSIILFVLVSAGLCYLIFPFSTSLPILFILSAWLGASLGASQPNVMSLLHQVTPDGRVAEAIGIRTMLMNASHTALPLIFGLGGSLIGAAAAFWTLSGLLLGGAGYLKRHPESPGRATDSLND